MPRYKLVLEYDGTPFVGWQRQDSGRSVQAAFEAAILKFTGETVKTVTAGRTDSGVHALGQVVHADFAKDWPTDTVRDALNFHLKPDPIAVLEATVVSGDFSARFSAVERNRVWHVPYPLDAAAMHEAAQLLVGHHDFSTFRASLCQARSPEKTLDQLDIARDGDEIRIVARARSFLHHQVRNMVGTLKLVGDGKWSRDDVAAALAARDRTRGGPTAPAEGLYLVAVRY